MSSDEKGNYTVKRAGLQSRVRRILIAVFVARVVTAITLVSMIVWVFSGGLAQ